MVNFNRRLSPSILWRAALDFSDYYADHLLYLHRRSERLVQLRAWMAENKV